MTVTQLALDVPDMTVDPLSDLDFDRHDDRLDALDQARARRTPFDAADFTPPPPAARCECVPRGIHVTDEDGTAVCWACGREVAPVADLKPRSRVPHGGATLRQVPLSGDVLHSDPGERP